MCLVPEVSPGCGWPWLRGVTVVSQAVLGCAVAAQSAAGDAQGCVAAPAEHSSPQLVPSPLGSHLLSLFSNFTSSGAASLGH